MSYDEQTLAENRKNAVKTAKKLFAFAGLLMLAFIVMLILRKGNVKNNAQKDTAAKPKVTVEQKK